MIQAPILHVNGDDPEACVRVMRLAFEYRQEFGKDIVIDLVCFRRHGHNEGDEPAYTQPLMYSKIEERRTVRKLYLESLLNRGELTVEEAEKSFEDFRKRSPERVRRDHAAPHRRKRSEPPCPRSARVSSHRSRPASIASVSSTSTEALTTFPEGFEPHPKLKQHDRETRRDARRTMRSTGRRARRSRSARCCWRGSACGCRARTRGRGTFSQRHSVFVDYRTEEEYVPLQHLGEDQAPFRSLDSILSEFGVMGFEYGYSIANGDALVCWEAQFGDFVNGAQVVVDQFIAAGEDKWEQESGLVLLLPHGYEGQGPEHSSARLERFLTLSAEDNIQVAQPTTAAQYFHLLRRQMRRSVRKPLIVMTPKSLLRLRGRRRVPSPISSRDTSVRRSTIRRCQDPEAVKRIVICTGKIAYPLLEARNENGAPVAIVRLEQLYPFPDRQLAEIFARYPNATEVTWVQDEPANMGGWMFIHSKLAGEGTMADGRKLTHVARHESGSPATGSQKIHEQEQQQLIEKALSL